MTGDGTARAHALRAAINTPIQGGAADIAMLAMLQIEKSKKLKDLGFRLLMQARERGGNFRRALSLSHHFRLGSRWAVAVCL